MVSTCHWTVIWAVSSVWCYILWHKALIITQPMVPSLVSVNIVEYKFFHRPDEVCLCLKSILLFRTLKDFILVINGYQEN